MCIICGTKQVKIEKALEKCPFIVYNYNGLGFWDFEFA